MENSLIRIFLLSCVITISVALKQGVPLFMWSTSRLNVPIPISGQTTSSEQFSRDYLGSLLKSQQNVVAFIQDKLSVDDITQHADVYNDNSDGAALHNLKGLMEDHSSTQLPSVGNTKNILQRLRKEFPGKVHELAEPYNVRDLPLDDSSNLIIAKLPSTGDSHTQFSTSLKRNDLIMKAVSDDLKSTGKPFTAVYTAEKSSLKRGHSIRGGRHLLSTSDTPFSFFNVSNCLYFYATEIEVGIASGDAITRFIVPNQNKSDDTSSACNSTGMLKLSYKDVPSNTSGSGDKMNSIEITFYFGIGTGTSWTGYWRNPEINITYAATIAGNQVSGTNVPLSVAGQQIYAPISASYSFSYHCTQTAPYIQKRGVGTADEPKVQLRFQNLQVQYGTNDLPIKNSQFGYPEDCDGFFTIGILSGLVVGLILVVILFFGICMIASITTMDRFDDPKGKTITVNVAESNN